ncbi:hypothetical protein FRC04_009196 [Tulasnella sp. 424]|nr:hypothetical protein FRC04_009196 [Tulasnella sp. 424]
MTEGGLELVRKTLCWDRLAGGYYHASERAHSNVTLAAHGRHILQSLTSEFPHAFALVFNSSKLSTNSAAIDVVMIEPPKQQGSRASSRPEKFDLADAAIPEKVKSRAAQETGLERLVVDFDDYLEDPSKDWLKNDAVWAASST